MTRGEEEGRRLMKKKRSVLFTVVVDLLFLAAIAVVGWKIYDYVKDGRQTKEVADELWAQAVITAAPETTAGSPATTPEPETETPPEAAAGNPEERPADLGGMGRRRRT